MCSEVDEIFRKEYIQSPVQGHEDFLFKSRQFQQVDRPPEPPGNEAGKVHAENVRHAGPLPNRRQESERRVPEGHFLTVFHFVHLTGAALLSIVADVLPLQACAIRP